MMGLPPSSKRRLSQSASRPPGASPLVPACQAEGTGTELRRGAALCTWLWQGKKFRWCTLSDLEQRKCAELAKTLATVLPLATSSSFTRVSCIRAHNTHDCIDKIRVNKADAASLDAGDVYSAVKIYGLTVAAKELYVEGNCVYAVAVASQGTLNIHSLKGTRSCHNGARWTSGWSIPLGFLLATNELMWNEDQPLSHAVSGFFNASCVPGSGVASHQLCALCHGQQSYIREKNHFCETSGNEPFYDSEGAFRCLKSGVADVAFLDHLTIMNATESEQENFELLCPDGSTAHLGAYTICNLGHGPGRAIVTRPNFQKITKKFLTLLQNLFGKKGKERARFELFGSALFRGKNLLFRDATQYLQLVEEEAEISHVLGLDYVALLQGLGHEGSSLSNSLVRWCCISDAELQKCEEWALSINSDPLVCVLADSMINCIRRIKNNEADAVTLDATHAYFAKKCALVPVAAECYEQDCSSARREREEAAHLAGITVYVSIMSHEVHKSHPATFSACLPFPAWQGQLCEHGGLFSSPGSSCGCPVPQCLLSCRPASGLCSGPSKEDCQAHQHP
ncbi:serotransferrin-2-like isoform X2 [Tiliqua scincoides]|uniref:serotransferrin-2-like isoform X2 n=1 Tax=Tiliqua scincoides TaxID=71010 RepID=UPI003462EDD5